MARGPASELTAALAKVPPRNAIPVDLRNLGWFPNARRPRVFWVGVEAGDALANLAHDIDTSLEPLGLAREPREFSPHLTLARIKQPVPLDNLHQLIASLESTDIASFEADRFYLYRSQPGSAGSIYTKLAEFRFSGGGSTVNPGAAATHNR